MTHVVQQISANGLQLPKKLMEQWGVREGQTVIIELQRSFIRIVLMNTRIIVMLI